MQSSVTVPRPVQALEWQRPEQQETEQRLRDSIGLKAYRGEDFKVIEFLEREVSNAEATPELQTRPEERIRMVLTEHSKRAGFHKHGDKRADMIDRESDCEYRNTCHFYAVKNMSLANKKVKELYCIEWAQKCAIHQAKATGKRVSITLRPTGKLAV
jgi:hypothetical protein